MHCIKVVYINTMMTFVINKYSIEGRGWGGKREKESGSRCVSKFLYPSIQLEDKTGWCKEITGMLGNF